MPIYEYVCQDCGNKFEKLIRSRLTSTEPACPTCGSGQTFKALSAFSSHTGGGTGGGFAASSAPACGPIG